MMLLKLLRGLARVRPSGRNSVQANDWLARALEKQSAGDDRAAEEALRQAIALCPDRGDASHALGALLLRGNRAAEAIAPLQSAARLLPREPAVQLHLAAAFSAQGSSRDALQALDAALALDPRLAAAHNNRGAILHALGELNDAEAAFAAAVALDRALADTWRSLARVRIHLGKPEAAMEAYRRVLQPPAFAGEPPRQHAGVAEVQAQWNLSHAQLATGALAEGWRNYELRLHPKVGLVPACTGPQASWRGEDLTGRTLLVSGEQGIGDEILFASMYPDLAARAGGITLECTPKLIRLFQRSFPAARIIARTQPPQPEALEAFDYRIAAGSLGQYLRPDIASFPRRRSYLIADAGRARYWRARLDALGPGLKVGFCWRSSNVKDERALACTRLEQWAPLFAVRGVHWVCLQYDECSDELREARERFCVALHRFDGIDYFDDLDEVAALMVALDLVISAPTTVSLQTAALGVPTWQMTFGTDWQTLGTQSNPWLPALQRFQRSARQSWHSVIEAVAAQLLDRRGPAAAAATAPEPAQAQVAHGRAAQAQAAEGPTPAGAGADERAASTASVSDDPAVRLTQALAHMRNGEHEAAQPILEELVRFGDQAADAHLMLAMLHEQRGRLREALASAEAAASMRPEFVEAHVQAGTYAQRVQDAPRAVEHLRVARRLVPHSAPVVLALGRALELAGEVDEAIAAYNGAIELEPANAAAWDSLASLHLSRKQPDRARAAAEHAVAVRPDSAKARCSLGMALRELGEIAEAERQLRRAFELDPHLLLAAEMLADLLHCCGREREAEALCRQLLAADPALEGVRMRLGSLCLHDSRIAEAIAIFAQGAAERSGSADSADASHVGGLDCETQSTEFARFRLAHGLAQLAAGNFAAGWADYEWRLHRELEVVRLREFPQPRWRGEPLAGRSIVVWGEQGIGDEIVFAGMYPDLLRSASRCVLECSPKLTALFARSFPSADVVGRADRLDVSAFADCDYQIPAGSLGGLLRPSLESFPRRASYLIADPQRTAGWRRRLSALGPGLKIGFSWRSRDQSKVRALACSRLDEWQALFAVDGVHWIALQYDECEDELAEAQKSVAPRLHRYADLDYFDDLDEVSSLTVALDLVISAPTTVSLHAAALGVEVWQLTYGTDWQTHGTGAVPWLPTLTVFRRAYGTTWPQLIGQVAQCLQARIELQIADESGGRRASAGAASSRLR